jgi:hypothetical protein
MTTRAPAAGAEQAIAPLASEAPLEWSYNPWRQDTIRAVVGSLVILLVWAILASLRLVPVMGALLMLAFAFSLGPAYLVAHCRVDDAGVGRRIVFGWDRRAWAEIRRAVTSRDGLFVSPVAEPGLRASFRGLWLPVPSGERPRLLPELRRRVAQHGL